VRYPYSQRHCKKIHQVFLVSGIITQPKKDRIHDHKKGPAGELTIPVYLCFSAQSPVPKIIKK
jgi:hypothetical protein